MNRSLCTTGSALLLCSCTQLFFMILTASSKLCGFSFISDDTQQLSVCVQSRLSLNLAFQLALSVRLAGARMRALPSLGATNAQHFKAKRFIVWANWFLVAGFKLPSNL